MKINFLLLALTVCLSTVNAQKSKKLKLNSTTDSVSYCIGLSIGNSIKSQNISGLDPKLVNSGLFEAMNSEKGLISVEDAEKFLREYFTRKQQAEAGLKKEMARKFFEGNKKNPGIVELASGLQYMILNEGSGALPVDSNIVKVHYKGTLMDGTVFDSSYERNEPAEFQVNGLIPGFTEALLLMKTGAKWTVYIPPHLAYGEQGAGGTIGPNEVLIFDIELIEIVK